MSGAHQLQGQYLAGDGCAVKVKGSTDIIGILALIFAYCVFDSSYLAEYAMLLADICYWRTLQAGNTTVIQILCVETDSHCYTAELNLV